MNIDYKRMETTGRERRKTDGFFKRLTDRQIDVKIARIRRWISFKYIDTHQYGISYFELFQNYRQILPSNVDLLANIAKIEFRVLSNNGRCSCWFTDILCVHLSYFFREFVVGGIIDDRIVLWIARTLIVWTTSNTIVLVVVGIWYFIALGYPQFLYLTKTRLPGWRGASVFGLSIVFITIFFTLITTMSCVRLMLIS